MVKSLIFCLNLAVMCCFFVSCHQHDWYKKEFSQDEMTRIANQINEGAAHYYQGSVPNMELIREGIKMDSTIPDLWRELATPYLKRGMPHDAIKYYKKEIELAPELWQGWRGYLYLYFYRDYERAIADFNATDTLTSMTDFPQGQSVDYMRGLCYYGMKDYDPALKFFTRNIDDVTREKGEQWVDTYAFLYRALSYEKLRRFDHAIKDLETGLKYDPRLSDFHYHIARIKFMHFPEEVESIQKSADEALIHFKNGYFHQRDYVEVHDQLYLEDLVALQQQIIANRN